MPIYAPTKNISQFVLLQLILGFLWAILFVDNPFGSVSRFFIALGWSIAIFSSQWIGNAYFQGVIAQKFSWLEEPLKRMCWTVFSVITYSIVAFIAVQFLMHYLVFGYIPKKLYEFNLAVWGIPILVSLVVSIIIAAISFFTSWKKALVEQERLKNEVLTYKYESLRNQINPHFMFNSLNVLSDLVHDDQDLAVQFIHEFSDIYRYVLDSKDKELVSLAEEKQFIEKFIFLLKIRFDNKLIIEMDIPDKEKDLIVPLSLQLLIENAVKHNEASGAFPLNVSIIRKNDRIYITNPIQPKNVDENSKKIGLKNLRQQFDYFMSESIEIKNDSKIFEVSIPILKKA